MNTVKQIAMGLPTILRQVAWVRVGLLALTIGYYIGFISDANALLWLLPFGFERVLFVGLVQFEAVRAKLGKFFLPVALGWLLVVPFIEIVILLEMPAEMSRAFAAPEEILSMSSPLIWLTVPLMLAVWQYRQTGLRIVLAAIVVEHSLLGGILFANNQFTLTFVVNALARLAVLAILGHVVLWLLQAQRKERAALEQANRQLSRHAVTAQQLAESRERNRLARELHDNMVQTFTTVTAQLQAIETWMEQEPVRAKVQLRDAQTLVRTSATELRRTIKRLRSTPLDELGLAESLRDLCREFAARTTVHIDYAIGDLPVLDPLTEQAIYRIASETLANVERHAAATLVQVDLRELSTHKLCLSIRDNGVGFEQKAIAEGQLGLVGMFERAKEIGAELRVESAEHRGTRIELELGL